ncbi:hypothetical protein QUV44_07475 [Parasutterella secunda]|uniref:hypothetical protein n=1 Tax=Parasutterella secunda TaxID=626947 RepID=UPI0025A33BE3|nr:hypothetical protein [Parasutterella secunda]MDM8088031.1 hypothetical protein [Parasutterella secunda]
MLYLVTENKGIRFLLSCLLFKIWRGDFDKDFDESFESTPLDWELTEDGPEARYLKLLYKRTLDFHLVKSLFTQTVKPPVCDVIMEDTIFERLVYGGFHLRPSPALYELIFRKDFYDCVRHTITIEDLDEILGWPKDLASVFFPFMYGEPLKKSVKSLGKALGFEDWEEGFRPESKQISLPKKPRECPFCHSKQVLDVLVGFPAFRPDLKKYHLYGCCTFDGYPPPDWYCKYCGLSIWKTSNLNGKDFEVSANKKP